MAFDERTGEVMRRAQQIARDWSKFGEMVVGETGYISLEHIVLVLVSEIRPTTLPLPIVSLQRARQLLAEFIPPQPAEAFPLGKVPLTIATLRLYQRASELAGTDNAVTVEHLWAAIQEQNIPWLPAFLERIRSLGGDIA
jgi:hypothetical protein